MSDVLTFKNKKTGKSESIRRHNLEIVGWGYHFFVDTEFEAYRSAYECRNNKHGVKVEFAHGVQKWMITVFNATAKKAKIDGAK